MLVNLILMGKLTWWSYVLLSLFWLSSIASVRLVWACLPMYKKGDKIIIPPGIVRFCTNVWNTKCCVCVCVCVCVCAAPGYSKPYLMVVSDTQEVMVIERACWLPNTCTTPRSSWPSFASNCGPCISNVCVWSCWKPLRSASVDKTRTQQIPSWTLSLTSAADCSFSGKVSPLNHWIHLLYLWLMRVTTVRHACTYCARPLCHTSPFVRDWLLIKWHIPLTVKVIH